MQIDKTDIEASARIFCDLMLIGQDDDHPCGLKNWQVAADRLRETLTLNEAMRMHLANREAALKDKIQDIANTIAPTAAVTASN